MTKGKIRTTRRILLWPGLAFAALSVLIFAMNYTAMPVVLDVPLIALVFAGVAGIFLAIALFCYRVSFPGARTSIGIAAVGLLGALGIAILSAHLKFFSFEREDLRFTNGTFELAGTLYLPRSQGPHAAAVFVHGSGPEPRGEYAYYAQRFAQAGVAGLVYDKRGVGESSGKLYQTDYQGYAADAAAAFRALRSRADIDGDSIGFVGFSEGEWTAPLAAHMVDAAAFIAVVGASGTSPAEQVNAEIAIRLHDHGYSHVVIAKALELNNRVFAYQRTGHGADQLQAELDAVSNEPWFFDAGDIPSRIYQPEEYAWWRSVMDFDPRPVWERISGPVLLLKGARDAHSPADTARREITSALAHGGNANVDFVLVPNGDHMLLEWPLGESVPPPMFAERWLETLIHWVRDATSDSAQQSAPADAPTARPPG